MLRVETASYRKGSLRRRQGIRREQTSVFWKETDTGYFKEGNREFLNSTESLLKIQDHEVVETFIICVVVFIMVSGEDKEVLVSLGSMVMRLCQAEYI